MRTTLTARVRRVVHNPLVRSAAILSGATAIGQGAIVLTSPLITRLYDPSHFGILAVFVAILSPLVVVSSLSYQLAVPLPEDEHVAADLLALSVVVGVGVTALVAATAVLFGSDIAALVNTPDLGRYLWLLPVSLFGATLYQALSMWAVRRREFKEIAKTRLTQSMGVILVQLFLGILRVRPMGLLVGDSLGRAAGSGALSLQAWRGSKRALRTISLRGMQSAARRYRRFPLLSTWSVLFNSASQSAPAILMATLYGPRAAGWLALGQRVIAVPMRTIGQSVAQVYVGNAAALSRSDVPKLRRLYMTTVKQLFLIGAIPFTAVAVLGSTVFGVVFGAEWVRAGEYSQLLAAMFLVQFVAVPVSQTLNVLEELGQQLAWDLLRLILVVGVFWISAVADASSGQAVAGYAGVLVLAYCVQLMLSYRAIRRHEGIVAEPAADGPGGPEASDLRTQDPSPDTPERPPHAHDEGIP